MKLAWTYMERQHLLDQMLVDGTVATPTDAKLTCEGAAELVSGEIAILVVAFGLAWIVFRSALK